MEQGLPANTVDALCFDRKGFLWAGTSDGLARYDGYGFKVFRSIPGDSLSLLNNQITCLMEDREGVLWTGSSFGIARYNRLKDQFDRITEKPQIPGSLKSNVISFFHEDKSGRFYVGSAGAGLFEYDRTTQKFMQYFPDTLYPDYAYFTLFISACNDKEQSEVIWFNVRMKNEVRLYRFDTRDKRFTQVDLGDLDQRPTINGIVDDGRGNLWISKEQSILLLNKATGQIRLFDRIKSPTALRYSGIYIASNGAIWISTYRHGVFEYLPESDELHAYDVSQGLPDNWVKDVTEDRSGVMWIATNSGLVRWYPESSRFKTWRGDPNNPAFAVGGIITALCEDTAGRVWIGTNWRGIDVLDRKSNQYLPVNYKPGDLRKAITWVFSLKSGRNNRVWIGSNSRGLFELDLTTGSYTIHTGQSTGLQESAFNYVQSLHEDRQGYLWVGTFGGLYRRDPEQNTWTSFVHDKQDTGSLCSNALLSIFEDRRGDIWVGTTGGLSLYDGKSGKFRHYLHDPADSTFLRSGEVLCITDDQQDNIWAGTPRGLYHIKFKDKERSSHEVVHYTEKQGLLRNRINGVMEDSRGRLWISSTGGLSVFKNPQHDAATPPDFQHYNVRDGLQGHAFSQGAFFKNHRGEMMFGGDKGFNIFHPDSIRDNPHIPPVVITAFETNDADHPEAAPVSAPGIAYRDAVTLSHKNNIITIRFAALDFRDPAKNRYAYQLEGFSDAWVQIGNQHQVTFTNLDPGTYYFRVKGSNNDGVWNEQPAVLKIIIRPPWYRSWLAYALYVILLAGGIYGLYRFQLSRRLQMAESERLKSLDEFKTRFFTNITHEFRTPLTVILGMVEQLAGQDLLRNERSKSSLNAIKRSGENLLRLINQILDLARLENNALKINYVQGDFLRYIRYLSESLQSLANARNLILRVESDQAQVVMDYDPDRVLQIVHNLVSNAVKFTPSGGVVAIRVALEAGADNRSKFVLVSVKDNGAGIPPEELPYLFDRFFQAKNQAYSQGAGTGIGLSLTRELVRAMGGDIWAESEGVAGKGAVFFVQLPLRQSAEKELALDISPQVRPAAPMPEPNPAKPAGNEAPHLLIIEDNPDVVEYLQMCLSGHYQLDFAYNGRAGIEKALQTIPDLIISDVMMPEKDGFEVCDTLKQHELSSHIPLVLLTARADVESRIAGLRRGADAYLAKPFHQEELLLTLRNMLDLRKRLQARLSGSPAVTEEVPGLAQENAFVQKVRAAVESKMSDAEFSVEDLCRALAMSQSQLHRKLSALTGTNATLFIRSVRLEKARLLLSEPDQTVSQVAYAVGFDDPKYFSRVFTEEFGVPPSKLLVR